MMSAASDCQSFRFGGNLVGKCMATQTWILKPEVEFQHGGRLFSETVSSNISAMDWAISPKFDLQVNFDVRKWAKSRKIKPEVELQCHGRRLGKWTWRHIYVAYGPIWKTLVRQMQNDIPMVMQSWKSKQEVVIVQSWIEISRRNLAGR